MPAGGGGAGGPGAGWSRVAVGEACTLLVSRLWVGSRLRPLTCRGGWLTTFLRTSKFGFFSSASLNLILRAHTGTSEYRLGILRCIVGDADGRVLSAREPLRSTNGAGRGSWRAISSGARSLSSIFRLPGVVARSRPWSIGAGADAAIVLAAAGVWRGSESWMAVEADAGAMLLWTLMLRVLGLMLWLCSRSPRDTSCPEWLAGSFGSVGGAGCGGDV